MNARLIERRLVGHALGDTVLLDVIEDRSTPAPTLTLFFAGPIDPAAISEPPIAALQSHRLVSGASVITYALAADASRPALSIGDARIELIPAEAECDFLEGANALVGTRNGESSDVVLDWLSFHINHQGLTGAVILDRAAPGSDKNFARELKQDLEQRQWDCTVVLVTSDLPLGKAGLPPEAHPFCVPESPGKDRMLVPPASPWDAPLGALCWYEIARARFLADARAVANLDVHDLVVTDKASIFDSALASTGGVIPLLGRHCYPWRIRKGQSATFGDHICVQFDARGSRTRWCIAPAKAPVNATWRLLRIGNAAPDRTRAQHFFRHMALRHPTDSISQIVPKTSLIEHAALLEQAKAVFGSDPVRIPDVAPRLLPAGRGRRAIVTTMKNEGPFILEWLAYHRAIGFDDILVYTNDCTDGTDTMLELLMDKGLVEHRENRFRDMNLKPQHAALQMAEDEAVIRDARWVTCIDVDEYVNIKVGDGTLDALFAAVPDANMIAMTWRLFGNANVHSYHDAPITEQFQRCAAELTPKPHQAWGFKTLFENIGIFKKLGVHRPKGLNPQLWEMINWVNGSGAPLPREIYRNGWRCTTETYGYDLVQLNHYAVRSVESFLVKRDRGRVNHVDRDQGLAYWFRMNNNAESDDSILCRLPMMHKELARLKADPDIAAAHEFSVAQHRAKIDALMATRNYAAFYKQLTSDRLQKLSHLHGHFGANVFLSGPDVIPDEILAKDPAEEWFFTVNLQGETAH